MDIANPLVIDIILCLQCQLKCLKTFVFNMTFNLYVFIFEYKLFLNGI